MGRKQFTKGYIHMHCPTQWDDSVSTCAYCHLYPQLHAAQVQCCECVLTKVAKGKYIHIRGTVKLLCGGGGVH